MGVRHLISILGLLLDTPCDLGQIICLFWTSVSLPSDGGNTYFIEIQNSTGKVTQHLARGKCLVNGIYSFYSNILPSLVLAAVLVGGYLPFLEYWGSYLLALSLISF